MNKTFTVHDKEAFSRYMKWNRNITKYKMLMKLQLFIDDELKKLEKQKGDE